jgi:glyoxylase-like metal-dependent hydrolase (beta-lactamase superfamily II)
MKISSILEGTFKLDGGAMFGVVPRKLWNKLNPSDEQNLCTWALRCLLVEEGNTRLLIDSGMGDKQDERFFSHYEPQGEGLIAALGGKGYRPEDITDVLLTHLHFDHCGGTIRRKGDAFEAVFPNARIWVDRRQWEWAVYPNAREKASFLTENILPIQELGLLNFLPEDENSPWPWMKLFRCFGHTESMVLPVIDAPSGKLVFCADLFPSVHHIPMAWVMGYDMRPLETLEDKRRFFEKALQEKWTLFFEHDPLNECAVLENTEKGIRAGKGMQLVEAGF